MAPGFIRIIVCTFVACALCVNALCQKVDAPRSIADSLYSSLYDGLRDMKINPEKSATVKELVLRRDAGVITFRSGRLVFCHPVHGRVCAAVFVGEGVFECTPPTQIERDQCERHLKTTSVRTEFKNCVLLFSDTTYSTLSAQLKWRDTDIEREANDVLDRSRSFFIEESDRQIESTVCSSLLEGFVTTGFWAHFSKTPADDIIYAINPYRAEEVSIWRHWTTMGFSRRLVDLICQFHKESDYRNGIDPTEHAGAIDIVHYDIDLSINERLILNGTVSMQVIPRYDDRHWIPLSLSTYMGLKGAGVDTLGADATWGGSAVWFYSPKPLKKGVVTTITLAYEGEPFLRQVDHIYMKSGSSSWYPQTYELSRSTFDMHFHVADNLDFHSAGELDSSYAEAHVKHYHFIISEPDIHASFVVGVFEEMSLDDKNLPPVRILYERHSDHQDNVAQDVMLSLGYFRHLFGDPPFDKMTAAQINHLHGQAFPGFLHLPYSIFYSGEASGHNEQFVAHEVAHQWWGGSVGWTNYHDQWMSEAFAEYSSMMYMQSVMKNNKEFFDMLAKYKSRIIETRKSFLKNGVESGPIWLGSRLSSTNTTAGDYTIQIYYKGAWVMHMLRNMMMDFDDFSDERFIAMMKEFYATFKGQDATTEDFKRVVSKHMRQDMTWFFDQWIYGTKIPKYTVSHEVKELANNKFDVTMRIRQENVPPSFRMIIPIRLNFGDEIGSSSLQINVTGADSELKLPTLPFKPLSIDFNIYDSVLCEWDVDD